MNVSWREPLWLLFISYPLLHLAWHYYRQRKQTQQYTDTALLPWVQAGTGRWQRAIRPVLWGCFWSLIAIVLAGPRLPLQDSEIQTQPNKTIMLVVDVSRSMHTADISPTRLQRATLEVYELLSMVHASRIGIIVYAARPHLLVPATDDLNAVRFYSEKLDTLILPTLGSDAVAALHFAEKQLHPPNTTASQPDTSILPRMIVWLTDGDIALEQQAALKNRVQQLAQADLSLYILGIGTEDGEAIPIMQDEANQQWLHHEGKIVRSQLNSRFLQQLSQLGKGRYSSVRDDESDWQILYKKGIEHAFQSAMSNDKNDKEQQWHELYVWPLFAAMLLLFTLITLPRHLLALFIVISLPLMQPAKADTDTAMTLGVSAYRSENYQQAIKHFSRAVFKATEDVERARALHNLGNSYFQHGNYTAAIQVFRDALTYRPQHIPTLNNLSLGETVQTELERQLVAKQQQQESNGYGGNRFERLSNALDGDQQSTKTWGEGKSTLTHLNLPNLPLDATTMNKLVNNGLKRLAQSGENDIAGWKKSQQTQHQARIALQQMDDNPAVFWKRLFEIEEGFPAPLDAAKEVPEVLPW
jgi:Ca-activated chloride channel family protein